MQRFVILCLSSAMAVVLASCGESTSPRDGGAPVSAPKPPPLTRATAERAARAYVEAFNHRDGRAICVAWTPAVRTAVMRIYARGMRVHGCPAVVTTWIGYGEDVGIGGWIRARVRSVGAARVRDGRSEVPVVEHHLHDRNGDRDLTVRDVLHLVPGPGGWRVAKQGLIWFAAVGATQVPDSALDPPADPARLAQASRVPPPRFACGRPSSTVVDPVGDVAASPSAAAPRGSAGLAPWLDVRRVALSTPAGGTCAAIELAAPSRPETRIVFSVHQPTGGSPGSFHIAGGVVRIDGLGHAHAAPETLNADPLVGLPPPPAGSTPRVGVRGRTIFLLIPKVWLKRRPFQWQVAISSTQADDPSVARPVVGTDGIGPARYRP